MKRTLTYISWLLPLAFPNLARCELLWDNGEWDSQSNAPSERNTAVPDAWLVDDFIVPNAVTVSGLHWWSFMNNEFPFTKVDVLIMNESFEFLAYLQDLPANRTFQRALSNYKIYTVDVEGFSVFLPSGRYFIGGRPVGNGTGHTTTCLNRTVLGRSQAYERSAYWGWPDWTPVGDIIGYPDGLDAAFKVYGEPVAEPATLFVIGTACGVLCLRKRK